jgi:hypothetical protein
MSSNDSQPIFFISPSPTPTPPVSDATFTNIPDACRTRILEFCSISSLLELYKTSSSLRHEIQHSPAIIDKVFNSVHDFNTDSLPPSTENILAADGHLHPLFAKAIAECYDGFAGNEGETRIEGKFFAFLLQRCRIAHEIDAAFKLYAPSHVQGLTRKLALLTFGHMLDCIQNWTVDRARSGAKGIVSSDEYFGWCVDIMGGFKHMVRSEEERSDVCDVVNFFYNLNPEALVRGWHPDRNWTYLGWRAIMLGFCLLGGLERLGRVLKGEFYLKDMRGEEEGLERDISRGFGRWIEFEYRERDRRAMLAQMQEGQDTGDRMALIGISDGEDEDEDYQGLEESEESEDSGDDENGDEDEEMSE